MESPLAKAIQTVGGAAPLARELGVSAQAVYFWRAGSRQLPAEHCPVIERLTAGQVRCEDLRPDVDWAYLRGTQPANPDTPPGTGR